MRPVRGWLADVGFFGASEQERRRSIPGDDLVPDPVLQVTQAITVRAPVGQIWPWLVQIGQGRAGFYSDSRWWDACVGVYYRLLSREQRRSPVGYRHVDDRVVEAWQNLRVGDTIADGPPGTAVFVVRDLVAGEYVVLFTDTHLPYLVPARWRARVHGELSDTTTLIPIDSGRTRVVCRTRASAGPFPFRWFAVPVVAVWGEAITGRKFLRGLRRRAERVMPGP